MKLMALPAGIVVASITKSQTPAVCDSIIILCHSCQRTYIRRTSLIALANDCICSKLTFQSNRRQY